MDEVKVTTDIEATDQLGMLVRRIQLESPRKGGLRKQAAAIVDLANKILDHGLGYFKVCDHAISEGSNRLNIGRSFSKHSFGFRTKSQYFSCGAINGDNAWFT